MMNSNAFHNTGNWDEAKAWIEHITKSGIFRLPEGDYPIPEGGYSPVTPGPDGTLEIWDTETGDWIADVPVGSWLILAFGHFMSGTFEEET